MDLPIKRKGTYKLEVHCHWYLLFIRKFVPEGWKSQQEFGEPVDQGWWVSTDHLLLLQLFGLAVLLQGDENFVSETFDSRHRRWVQVARVRVEQHYCTQAPQLSYVLQHTKNFLTLVSLSNQG